MSRERAFTLIELLVVMSIIMVLAGMLLVGIDSARKAYLRARCETEIKQILLALSTYENERGDLPPSGIDVDDNGKLSNPATGQVIYAQAWPAGWTETEHPLVLYLTKKQEVQGGLRDYPALLPKAKTASVNDDAGNHVYLVDAYGQPYRYLTDGRRIDGAVSRVNKRKPVMWSVGLDRLPDPGNNQEDDAPQDGIVDNKKELVDDLCSWTQ